jgi:2-octaprenyl-3-methyl-6-methoxy-1,4-benzoquinol hydroxylase/2-octaprenylphenol hydroxylase
VETERLHQHTAWQRFLKTGPLAFLPLSTGQSSIVWSLDSEVADDVLQLADGEFLQVLSEALEFRLGRVVATTPRAAFPLSWHNAQRWLDGRVLLIGDAAHGVHPLAGQGVNLGFGDVALLQHYIRERETLDDHVRLRRFERRRKAETATATHLFSVFKLLYGSENPFLCRMRDIGMSAVEHNPLIKRNIISSAMENMA